MSNLRPSGVVTCLPRLKTYKCQRREFTHTPPTQSLEPPQIIPAFLRAGYAISMCISAHSRHEVDHPRSTVECLPSGQSECDCLSYAGLGRPTYITVSSAEAPTPQELHTAEPTQLHGKQHSNARITAHSPIRARKRLTLHQRAYPLPVLLGVGQSASPYGRCAAKTRPKVREGNTISQTCTQSDGQITLST